MVVDVYVQDFIQTGKIVIYQRNNPIHKTEMFKAIYILQCNLWTEKKNK